MTSKQPKAIELAEWAEWFCRNVRDPADFRWQAMSNMATELRRLHSQNKELLESLVRERKFGVES